MKQIRQQASLYAVWAPALLILIASVQLFMAHVYDLTAWKGGGFGMFSTVDSQGARFLRIYLVTPNGRTAVEVPSDLQPTARSVRTFPRAEELAQLADQLAQATWVPYTYNPFTLDAGRGLTRMAGQVDDLAGSAVAPAVHPQQPVDDPPLTWAGQEDRPLFRTLQPGEPALAGQAIQVSSVQVELWRFRFDAQAHRLKAEKLLESKAYAKVDQNH
jgi:hypothetical protein